MSTFRVHKSRNYTVMSNHHFQNDNLSLRAMGLLSYMLSKPDDWKFSVEGIAAKCRDGKDSVRSAVKELEKYGYIVRRSRIRDENGHLKEAVYDVYETPSDNPDFSVKEQLKHNIPADAPMADNPSLAQENGISPMAGNPPLAKMEGNSPMAGNPPLGNPMQENPSLLNTNKLNTNITNNLSINQVSSNNKNKIHIGQKNDVIDEMDFQGKVNEINEHLEIDQLCYNGDISEEEIKEIVELIAWVMLTPQENIQISGVPISVNLVRKRFEMLDSSHIEYVFECLHSTETKIKNRPNYLLTCLFKAPITMEGYYDNAVRHDMKRSP